MSAFLCSNKHISAVVNFGMKVSAYIPLDGSYATVTPENAAKVARILFRANVDSLIARYGEYTPPRFRYLPKAEAPTIAAGCKLVRSLAYQSCETEGWETSDANRILVRIIGVAVTRLWGYEEAPWSI